MVSTRTGDLVDSTIIRPSQTLVGINRRIIAFPVTPQEMKFQFESMTRDSIQFEIEFDLVYHLQEENVSRMYSVYRTSYREILVDPETRWVVRKVMSQVPSDKVEEVPSDIEAELRVFYLDHYLVLDRIKSFSVTRISPVGASDQK